MDFKVMKRPMFRMGGPTSGGTGITSGLDTPKRGLVDGPGGYAGLSIKDAMSMGSSDIFNKAMVPAMLKRESNFKNAMSIPKLQAVGSIASNVLPNIERGGLKGIVDILKDPQTINAAIQGLSQTKSLELERDKQKLADLGTIFKGKSAIESQEFDKKYKTRTLDIAEKKALVKSATQLKLESGQAARKILTDNNVTDGTQLTDKILRDEYYTLSKISSGKLTPDEAQRLALKAVQVEHENAKKADRDQGGSGRGLSTQAFNDRVKFLTGLYLEPVEFNSEGGRVGRAMGGGFDMGQEQPMQAAQTMAPGPEMMPQGGGQDMGQDPFMILRERLPAEIPDEVVSLIAYNKAAFQDFANIQDQDDVDLFNQKYNVQLVVDMASR